MQTVAVLSVPKPRTRYGAHFVSEFASCALNAEVKLLKDDTATFPRLFPELAAGNGLSGKAIENCSGSVVSEPLDSESESERSDIVRVRTDLLVGLTEVIELYLILQNISEK